MPKLGAWDNAVRRSADPERARRFGSQLAVLRPDYFENVSQEQATVVAALFSGSKALTELLLGKPDWLEEIEVSGLQNPRRKAGVQSGVAAFLKTGLEAKDYAGTLRKLREFKQREMLRIAARDLGRFGTVAEVTEEISNVADVCLQTVYEVSLRQLTEKLGRPYALDPATEIWVESSFCVLGMGKLGGQELNYSSDIDVLFVYSGEGETFKSKPAKKAKLQRGTPNHQFYAKLAEAMIAECTRMTAEGFLFRVDMRLRPEGKTAPLARSLASYENYYAQWGQTWERMMLIKARCVAGEQALGAEFLEMIQPFRYPRSVSEQVPREVAEMKQRIENEIVRSGELDRNVKLGRGGIREIEFLVQTQQVLQGGRMPFLQGSKTLPALDKLKDYNLLDGAECGRLKQAYCFLRDIEHRLQMEDNRQTHTIPTGKEERARIAKLMGFATIPAFEKELQGINDDVRASYDRFINPPANGEKPTARRRQLPPDVAAGAEEWKRILSEHSFRDPDHCLKLVQEFVHGPGFGHRSSRTVDYALQLVARMLELCPRRGEAAPEEPFLSDPDRVLARLDSFVSRYGAQSMLYDAWVSNPSLFRLLLLAFDRSEFLAELAIRVPDLIDEIEQSGQLRRRRSTEQVLEDLRHGATEKDQHRWLRRYYQAEQMRIGLRDILDLADPETTQAELSALADAFLTYALEVVLKKNRLKKAPFAILGLGKLGGRELIYASDLDIIFVAESRTANLPGLQKIAAQIMELLSKRTEDGSTFETDARLRPDGEKGLLVNMVSAYGEYYKKRALLWEIQSLSRFRGICGNEDVQKNFVKMATQLIDFSERRQIAAYSSDWKNEIHRMRMRIEKERTPPGQEKLAIKTGRGGLMDVEFVAQVLCLENGWHEPNTLAAIGRAVQESALSEESGRVLTENYRKLMQIERILRRWSFEPESMLPREPAPYYRVAVRCGYKEPHAFERAVFACREAIRSEYNKAFGTAEK